MQVVYVEEDAASEMGLAYFRVLQRGKSPARHIIPIVAEMIPSFRPNLHHVMISPPAGLLELGQNCTQMDKLQTKLQRYAKPEDKRHRWCRIVMPQASLLASKGRTDLIKEINDLGGFAEVAAILGWKFDRRPWGAQNPFSPQFSDTCTLIRVLG